VKEDAMTRSDNRILVPLDGSLLAELALAEALALSKLPDTEVTFLQVVPPIEDVITIGLQEIPLDQQWDLQKEQALRYLRTITARPDWHGVQANVAVEMGKPAEAILAFAEQHGVDRMVMSTHGRTGLGRWVFGSVADKILRAADTTVVLGATSNWCIRRVEANSAAD
jgi:nucleotide-binding universal stress UspA family protein